MRPRPTVKIKAGTLSYLEIPGAEPDVAPLKASKWHRYRFAIWTGVILVAWLMWSAVHSPALPRDYGFLHQFSHKGKLLSNDEGFEQFTYEFSAPVEGIRATIKKELQANGWEVNSVTEHDETYGRTVQDAFTRNNAFVAFVAHPMYSSGKGTTCVFVGEHDPTGIEKKLVGAGHFIKRLLHLEEASNLHGRLRETALP